MSMKNNKCTTLLMVVYTLATVAIVAAELQRFDYQPTKADGSLDILVVGDWGRRGLYNQSNVAFQMGKVGEKLDADFIISTGDNFYEDGLLDEEDDLFVESFTQVYTATSLQKQWYSVLGNHDYRGNALAQLSPVLTQKDNKWLCLRSFIVKSGIVEFFFFDTTPFQDKYFTEEDHKYDWRGVLPRDEYLSNSLKSATAAKNKSRLHPNAILVLGNHDYRGNVLAQLSPALRQRDSKWLCLRSFIVNSGNAEFFFVDTTPFQDKYFTEDKHEYDWRGVLPREEYLSNVLKEVDMALEESSAQWKIVIGHHTIFSAGHHGNTQELVDQLLPILEANEVDLYINGHDHCLQHISSQNSQIQFLTSGGGSKAWRGDINQWNPNEMKFYYDGQGFITLRVTENEINVAFYDIFGKVIHKWSTTKYTHTDS